jgi:hypothetical protein
MAPGTAAAVESATEADAVILEAGGFDTDASGEVVSAVGGFGALIFLAMSNLY